MEILIARPKLHLPARFLREQESERAWKSWRKQFWISMAAAISIAALNSAGLKIALDGGGKWAIVPMLGSVLPVMWLFDKVAFAQAPDTTE